MSISDDDITNGAAAAGEGTADGGANPGGHDGGADGSAAAGEGTADGGANPDGHDGGADGSAGEGTADGAPTPTDTTAEPTDQRSVSTLRRRTHSAGRFAGRAFALHQHLHRRVRPRLLVRRPLLSPADTLGDGFDDLFSTDAVDELVSERGVRTPFIRMAHEGSVLKPARYTASGGFGAEVGDQVSSDKVLAEFAGGATIVLQGLHRLWPPLIDFTRRLIDDVGHPAQVNAYVTPASSRGFDPHYDTHDVFVLQIAGEKHWTIHAPVHTDPLSDQPWSDHAEAVAAAAEQQPVIDQVLRPGDALYLPRGWIHSAKALGNTSVHLTIGMAAYTRADVVDALLSVVGDAEDLRTSLPLGIDLTDADALRPVVEQTVHALMTALADSDGASELASRRLSSRLAAATRPEPVRPLATIAAVAALSGDTRVRWRGSLPARIDEADGRVRLRVRAKDLSLPAEASPALRQLAEGEDVAISDLEGLDDASAIVVVRRLLREGILVATE